MEKLDLTRLARLPFSYRAERLDGPGCLAYKEAEGVAVAFQFAVRVLASFVRSRCMHTPQHAIRLKTCCKVHSKQDLALRR